MSGADLLPAYRRRGSPIHSVRAVVAIIYLVGICGLAIAINSPIALTALSLTLLAIVGFGHMGRDLRPFFMVALILALLVTVVNPLVSREGLTVIVRGPLLPLFGQMDVTLEALVYGLVMGLRAFIVVLAAGIYTVAVDPDEVLRLFRRVGFHSAMTASLATRMVTLLARDFSRLSQALKCRPAYHTGGGWVERIKLRAMPLMALMEGALERSVNVAMALEVRGFGLRKPSGTLKSPWLKGDVAFLCSGLLLIVLALASAALGLAQAQIYPAIEGLVGGSGLIVAAIACVLMLVPFLPGFKEWRADDGGNAS